MSTEHDLSTPHGIARYMARPGLVGDATELRAMAWEALRVAGDRARRYLAADPAHRPSPSPRYALLLLALLDRAEAGDDGAAWIVAEVCALSTLEVWA
jgi:hypothetical protein